MLAKIKANLVPCIMGCLVTILGLVGMICYFITNGLPGYSFNNGFASFLAVMCFVLPLIYTLLLVFVGDKFYLATIIGVVTIVFEIILIGILINGRILTIAAVSSYDSGNQVAWTAVRSAIVGIVFLLLSAIAMVVAGFQEGKEQA